MSRTEDPGSKVSALGKEIDIVVVMIGFKFCLRSCPWVIDMVYLLVETVSHNQSVCQCQPMGFHGMSFLWNSQESFKHRLQGLDEPRSDANRRPVGRNTRRLVENAASVCL